MANISKVKIGNTSYDIKDTVARTAIESLSSALIYKGTISTASGLTSKTNYKIGWCYKATARFNIADLGWIGIGDMLIAKSNYNSSFKASDWTVVQGNDDVFLGATSSTDGTNGLVPAPGTTNVNQFLRGNGTWSNITTDLIAQGSDTFILDCGTSTINV